MEQAKLMLILFAITCVSIWVLAASDNYPMCPYCKHMRRYEDKMLCAKCGGVQCKWVGGTRWCVYEPKPIEK